MAIQNKAVPKSRDKGDLATNPKAFFNSGRSKAGNIILLLVNYFSYVFFENMRIYTYDF